MKYKYRVAYGGALLGAAEKKAIMRVINSNYWPLAEEGLKMEKEAAKFLGMKHGILTNSGSSAGLLALEALEIEKGSEVIIPAVTFPTIANIIVQQGFIPVVVDSKIGTYNLDPKELEAAISKKTKAIICVHALGNPVDMPAVMKIAKKYNLYVIEDNCLSGDTKIKTVNGDILLRDIRVGDEVLTRKGYRKVLRHIDRGERLVINKLGVVGTPDHPFITTKGVKSLDGLESSDILYTWNEKLSCIEERTITDILNPHLGTKGFITGLVQRLGLWVYTAKYGLTTMAQFLRHMSYTTKMITHLITTSLTSNAWQNQSIVACTALAQRSLNLQYETLKKHAREQSYGMPLLMVENGTANKVSLDGKRERVYDLEIEGEHEFFANGLLVHNCDGWGGSLGKKKIGSFGHISFTSFHAAHIVAMGQGGGVFTNDKELARKVRMYRDWGRQSNLTGRTNRKWKELPKDYDTRFIYEKLGYNLSPLELQAAMGRIQLRKAGRIKTLRQKNFNYLVKELRKFSDLIMPDWIDGADVCWFSLPLSCVGARGPLVAHLEKNGIETRSMFAGNFLKHPAYKNIKHRSMLTEDSDCNYILKQSFWIGVHPRMTQKDREYVIKVFKDYYAKTT